jgi:hypothetical protein
MHDNGLKSSTPLEQVERRGPRTTVVEVIDVVGLLAF